MKDRPILFGSLAAGLLASACCIGPLLLGALGLGSLGFGAWLAPARPWFLGLTAILVAVGFYLAYRPVPARACEPGEACATPQSRRPQRIMLWSVTVVAAALATYPSWSARLQGGRIVAGPSSAAAAVVTLDVSGMTCEACEGEIEQSLRKVPGVAQAVVDYEHASAQVRLADGAVDVRQLIAAVEKTGYRAKVPASATSGAASKSPSGLSGQWRGQLKVDEEGKTADLIVDLDRIAGGWTGQFDLPDFGVEDYPVEVTYSGPSVTLQLSAAQIEFKGQLGPKTLAGFAEVRGHRDSLVLRRVGEAQLSEEFLHLEAISGDSTRVQQLSPDGRELRQQFNADRANARLLMLLSPT